MRSLVTLLLVAGSHAMADTTSEILVTAEDGRVHAPLDDVPFEKRTARGTVVRVFPDRERHTIEGIGTSFTESSAYVLAHLDAAKRRELMELIYGAGGANFTLARTHIGSCDFTVDGTYSYADEPDDADLSSFSIAPDRAGFDSAAHPHIVDADYDLLPMITEALAIKRAQGDELRIVASAWTAPPWMKDIETWFIPGSEANGWNGTGGSLKPEYVPTYAEYLVRTLEAYREEGVPIWGLTPVNEPHGNSGFWESMHFTPESQNAFVNEHLGPLLHRRGFGDVNLLVYDQNRNELEKWAEVILGDPRSKEHVDGVAVHWYSSTYKVYGDVFERVLETFPETTLIHTEGCIDDLGKVSGGGVRDPEGFTEEGWFGDDTWWWNRNATDWAYSAEWWPTAEEDHPMYVPVHRYARDIISGVNHGLSGWIDWNIVLDRDGGPNHVGNFCGAPIMIDRETKDVHVTPIFHVLSQISRSIRPGDRVLATERVLGARGDDDVHVCATRGEDGRIAVQLLNTTGEPLPIDLDLGGRVAALTLPANSVTTVHGDG